MEKYLHTLNNLILTYDKFFYTSRYNYITNKNKMQAFSLKFSKFFYFANALNFNHFRQNSTSALGFK